MYEASDSIFNPRIFLRHKLTQVVWNVEYKYHFKSHKISAALQWLIQEEG